MKRRMTKGFAAMALCFLMLCSTVVCHAAVNNGAVYPVATNGMEGWPQGPELVSETAVLMDADTGAILYDKGMDELRYPASITKIMTTLLALENTSLEDPVTFTEDCLADQTWDSSNAGMQVGEVITMQQCLMVMMLKSANDVATQIAVHIAGSVPAFTDMMNQRAADLGCTNTHFVNASGMPDDNQYTTAHDMALIFREALKNDSFREIIGTQFFTLGPTNLNGTERTYQNHMELLFPNSQFYFEGCLGGKTGGSDSSMSTIVSGASRNGMTLIAVTMRAGIIDAWKDQDSLLDYGYTNFQKAEVEGGSVTLPAGTSVDSLKVTEEESEGKVLRTYSFGEDHVLGQGEGQKPAETEAPAKAEKKKSQEQETEVKTPAEKKMEASDSLTQVFRKIICVLAGLVAVSILLVILTLVKRRK